MVRNEVETMKRFLPAVIAFVITIAALWGPSHNLPQHPDEAQYSWSAAYFGGLIARLDLRPYGSDGYRDPGLSPASWWAQTQPMGARAIYALTMGLSGAPAPREPYSYTDPELQGRETVIPASTLPILRLAAMVCAALGFGLIAFRLGWAGLPVAIVMLLSPGVSKNLAVAWAEGPLLLGFGLAAASWGTRWFAPACGLAAAFKLIALPLWGLALWHGWGRGRFSRIAGFVVAAAVWTLLTPPSWFAGGPAFLVTMLADRGREYAEQSVTIGGPFGFFIPARYTWPVELALMVVLVLLAPRSIVLRRMWSKLGTLRIRLLGGDLR